MSLNLQSYKDALFQDEGVEERVEVNQRHLIDKILARYSAENTIFRELLQNSNDAGAEAAQIHFTTNKDKLPAPSIFTLPWSQKATVESVTYKNNGKPFSEEDFGRLRKIAEGNPDEQKIGFFGVGFYSLFSICEEPFITSGQSTMGFLWRNDMLYTKRGTLPTEAQSEWTTFYLATREPIVLPETTEFARFLATSLAFTTNIRQVEVFVDSKRVLYFNRKAAEPKLIDNWDRNSFVLKSPNSLFKLDTIAISQVQLDVEIVKSNVGTNYTIFMKIADAKMLVSLPRKMIEDMVRTTKKQPPKTTQLKLMFTNFEEYDGTMQTIKGAESIFQDLIPPPDKQGKIFIGFPTHQTTGCAIQIAGHLIPTVERESIDFVDKTLNFWNVELLSMGGLLSRVCFENELENINVLLKSMVLDDQSSGWFYQKVAHILNVFHFKNSTPSYLVGQILSSNFNGATQKLIRIISTANAGLVPASNVRLPPDADLEPFMKKIATVPKKFIDYCPEVIKQMTAANLIRPIGFSDVIEEISSRSFDEQETIALMKWCIKKSNSGDLNRQNLSLIQKNLIFLQGDEPIPISRINAFVTQRTAPNDLPIPKNCLPLSLSKNFSSRDLEVYFWGWKELQVIDWVRYITEEKDFGVNPFFTEKVLGHLSRNFGHASANDRAVMVSTLQLKKCITTQKGMVLPTEAYFESVSLFGDLPKISFSNPKNVSQTFLKALGVREHVELQLVFDRIGDLSWDQVQLIKYLSSIQSKLTPSELSTLKSNSLFVSMNNDEKRYRASELYCPSDKLKSFGLPILKWTGNWKFIGDEATFMKSIGLRTHIDLNTLFTMINTAKAEERKMYLKYFIDNYKSEYEGVYNSSSVHTPFIPTDEANLCLPKDCFSESASKVMGFQIIESSLQAHSEKFGVESYPNGDLLIKKLRDSLPNMSNAKDIFNFLASRQSFFTSRHWAILKSLAFIPIQRDDKIFHLPASSVYLKSNDQDALYQSSFVYITFGATADAFLRACGVKEQPTPMELASIMVKNPSEFVKNNNFEAYLELLRQIAVNYRTIKYNTSLLQEMKTSAFLIGIKINSNEDSSKKQEYQLARASDIYLIDDTVLSQLFTPLGAPIDEILEAMYFDLGSKWLSSQVNEAYSPKGSPIQSDISIDLQRTINDRAPILLYDGHQTRSKKELTNAADNLQNIRVFQVPQISIVRTFNQTVRQQETTACTATSKGEVVLVITKDFDYFDIASALAKLILKKHRLSDSLLISTFLSTSLTNLTQKGFPVDRILNLQAKRDNPPPTLISSQAEPVGGKNGSSVRSNQDISSKQNIPTTKSDTQVRTANEPKTSLRNDFGDSKSTSRKSVSDIDGDTTPDVQPTKRASSSNISSIFGGIMKNFTKNPSVNSGGTESTKVSNDSNSSHNHLPVPKQNTINPSQTKTLQNQLKQSVATVSSSRDSNVKSNFPNETSTPIVATTKQCVALTDQDLEFIQTINNTSVYIDRRVLSEGLEVLSNNSDATLRFSHVLQFLSEVFGLRKNCIQVYWDSDGSTIAFNRNRELFFNLRYYLGWHYQPIQQSYKVSMENPQTFYYWYMVFCHELAHNFHGPHDSTHEYWMSSFAEQYMGNLIQNLQQLRLQ
ncbi:hypothetical protein BC833DRAFT_616580 [Globomyces pollinis-pini]|nr:hypothetical protein BC833DRAFT_616580 [Globomyces pollinis-pini]